MRFPDRPQDFLNSVTFPQVVMIKTKTKPSKQHLLRTQVLNYIWFELVLIVNWNHNFIIILLKSKRIAFPTVMSAIWKITNTSSKAIPDELSWYLVNSRLFWVYSKFLTSRPLVLESSKGEFHWYFDQIKSYRLKNARRSEHISCVFRH